MGGVKGSNSKSMETLHMASFSIKDIKPNPFRHMDRYPIRREKVTALRESLRSTGFWDNVVARSSNGKAEIAYGHHRLVALKEEYGPNHKVDLIIRPLSDDIMIQMMARENMEEWGTSASVEHETVRAVVEAYADGRVHLPAVPDKTPQSQIRYAPSFIPGIDVLRARVEHPYTVQTLAEFIGWLKPSGDPQEKVYSALTGLQFIEERLLKESDFEGLTTKQAEAVIAEARKARDRREAAARVHRMQAEQAEREAKEAEQRREEAEREQRRKEIEATRARDEQSRRRAQEDARRLKREQREAEQARRQAEKRQESAKRQERVQVQQGRERATAVARAVSTELKKGKIGYRQAADVALKLEGKKSGPPPYIEDFAKRLATDIGNILDPDRDAKTQRLKQLIQYREYLNDVTRKDLALTLEKAAKRLFDYASQLGGAGKSTERRLLTRS
jgi:ParB/Sulfiredoxin domain